MVVSEIDLTDLALRQRWCQALTILMGSIDHQLLRPLTVSAEGHGWLVASDLLALLVGAERYKFSVEVYLMEFERVPELLKNLG